MSENRDEGAPVTWSIKWTIEWPSARRAVVKYSHEPRTEEHYNFDSDMSMGDKAKFAKEIDRWVGEAMKRASDHVLSCMEKSRHAS